MTGAVDRITPKETDAALAAVLEKQVCFKNILMRKAAVAITKAGLESNGDGFWPDHEAVARMVDSLGDQDKNVVGSAWRLLRRVGVIERLVGRRRSTAASTRGREIAQYRIANRALAVTFVSRNDGDFDDPQQPSLFPPPVREGVLK